MMSIPAPHTTQELKALLFPNGKLVHKALNHQWYARHGVEWAWDFVEQYTSFLDQEASRRERLYYVEMDMVSPVVCSFCMSRQCRLHVGGTPKFYKCCSAGSCKKALKAKTVSDRWQALTPEQHTVLVDNISKARKETEWRPNAEQRVLMAKRLLGKKQSAETTKKRVATRKSNGAWFTEETRRKLADSNHKTHTSKEFREKHSEAYFKAREKLSNIMKAKIASGSFTPPITNSWTHWSSEATNTLGCTKRFRSSWEAAFWLVTGLLYEVVRIPYQMNGKNKNYIVDFHDPENRVLYEVKPDSTRNTATNKAKQEAADKWCQENQYQYVIVGNSWLAANVTESMLAGNPQLKRHLGKFLTGGNSDKRH